MGQDSEVGGAELNDVDLRRLACLAQHGGHYFPLSTETVNGMNCVWCGAGHWDVREHSDDPFVDDDERTGVWNKPLREYRKMAGGGIRRINKRMTKLPKWMKP